MSGVRESSKYYTGGTGNRRISWQVWIATIRDFGVVSNGQPCADYVEVQQQLAAAENRAMFAEEQLQQERQRANRLEP